MENIPLTNEELAFLLSCISTTLEELNEGAVAAIVGASPVELDALYEKLSSYYVAPTGPTQAQEDLLMRLGREA